MHRILFGRILARKLEIWHLMRLLVEIGGKTRRRRITGRCRTDVGPRSRERNVNDAGPVCVRDTRRKTIRGAGFRGPNFFVCHRRPREISWEKKNEAQRKWMNLLLKTDGWV